MYIFAGYLLIIMSVLLLAWGTVQVDKKRKENQLMQSYMVTLQDFYQVIQAQIDSTRRFRHDLARHIQTLEYMMQEKEDLDLHEYADSLKVHYEKMQLTGESKSEVVNAVLSIKRQQCQEKRIPIFSEIEPKKYNLTRDIDLVGILANLLDNAIEENEKIEQDDQRGIWLVMREDISGKIYLQVKNKIRSGRTIDFQTEKQKKEEHGIGRMIVNHLVEQYRGQQKFEIDQEENIFCTEIILKNKLLVEEKSGVTV